MSVSRIQQLMIDYGHLDNVVDIDGNECQSTCPICNRDKKFYFNSSGFCICFRGCIQGNIYTFFKDVVGLSFIDTKKILKDSKLDVINTAIPSSGVSSLFDSLVSEDNIKPNVIKKMPPLPTNTKKILDNLGKEEVLPYLKYLKDRGITDNQLLKYDIRYCDSGVVKGRNKDIHINKSIIFITYNNRVPVYWNTRSILKKPFLKTFNAIASSNEFSKKDSVFNLNNVSKDDIVVLCESVFNALTVSDVFKNLKGVATFGKMITDIQLDKILSKNPKRLYLALDPDAIKETCSLINRILSKGLSEGKLYTVEYQDKNKDLNDLGKDKSIDLLKKAKPCYEYNSFNKLLLENLGG